MKKKPAQTHEQSMRRRDRQSKSERSEKQKKNTEISV